MSVRSAAGMSTPQGERTIRAGIPAKTYGVGLQGKEDIGVTAFWHIII